MSKPGALARLRRSDLYMSFRSSRLASVEVQFLAETHYGAAILSRLVPAGEGAYAHAIVREEDGKELARLATRWARREGPASGDAGEGPRPQR